MTSLQSIVYSYSDKLNGASATLAMIPYDSEYVLVCQVKPSLNDSMHIGNMACWFFPAVSVPNVEMQKG